MKGSIIRVAISVLMLFVLYSCKGIAEEEQQSDPVPAVLGLDIVLSTATGDGDVPERERVKELRFIMINMETKQVEFNRTLPVDKLQQTTGQFRYIYTLKDIETTTGTKVFYALANAEELIVNIVNSKSGEAIIEGLTQLRLESGFFKQEKDIPIISKPYQITLEEDKASGISPEGRLVYLNRMDIVMAYAAVKFDFTFNSQLEKENINIVEWQIGKVAQNSYLIPRINEWEKLIALAGTSDIGGDGDMQGWVTDYDVPLSPAHEIYSHVYSPVIPLAAGAEGVKDPVTHYMHESRYLGDDGKAETQEYYFILKVRTSGMAENAPVIILTGKEDGKFPNLKSLVRGTHVVVNVTVTKLPDAGENGLDVRVKTWIDDPVVDGDWEEVPQSIKK